MVGVMVVHVACSHSACGILYHNAFMRTCGHSVYVCAYYTGPLLGCSYTYACVVVHTPGNYRYCGWAAVDILTMQW